MRRGRWGEKGEKKPSVFKFQIEWGKVIHEERAKKAPEILVKKQVPPEKAQ